MQIFKQKHCKYNNQPITKKNLFVRVNYSKLIKAILLYIFFAKSNSLLAEKRGASVFVIRIKDIENKQQKKIGQ